MEIREVKIEEYWPQIVKGTAEFGEIAAALNPEFNKLAKCIYAVLNESFVADASEYGVSRWENILGINPAAGASLDDRKAAILTYLNVKTPYTWRVLKQMLVPILGGEDKFVMEYINDEGKLVLHTDRLDDAMLTTVDELLSRVLPQNIEVVRYNHHIDISLLELNKYAECVSYSDVLAVNPDYKNDLTSDGWWVYPWTNFYDYGNDVQTSLFFGSEVVTMDFVAKRLNAVSFLEEATRLKKLKFKADAVYRLDYFARNASALEEVDFDCKYCALSSSYLFAGCKSLREIRFKQELAFGSVASNFSFSEAILSKESVLNIFEKVKFSTYSSIILGIHIDHQNDPEVLAAIANAKANGWTLTVQWNGTPTSGISTMDLEEIWCKVTEDEHGEYTDENGNRCTLEWGHYVTDTSAYKLFVSLVEAEQYFKLTKVNENE